MFEKKKEELQKQHPGRHNNNDTKRRRRHKSNDRPNFFERKRLIVDFSKRPALHSKVAKLLNSANDKELGRTIDFPDLLEVALKHVTPKDIETLKEQSLTQMDKVSLLLKEYNQKNGTNLDLADFLVKELKIQ